MANSFDQCRRPVHTLQRPHHPFWNLSHVTSAPSHHAPPLSLHVRKSFATLSCLLIFLSFFFAQARPPDGTFRPPLLRRLAISRFFSYALFPHPRLPFPWPVLSGVPSWPRPHVPWTRNHRSHLTCSAANASSSPLAFLPCARCCASPPHDRRPRPASLRAFRVSKAASSPPNFFSCAGARLRERFPHGSLHHDFSASG